jgi:DHA1 family tetracycline resistance protein-like MFS transporter
MAAIGIAGGATGALCLAAGARRALSNDCKLRRALTADEWSFVLKQRLSDVITGVAFALHNPGWTAGYISLAGSAEQMVAHYAVCSTVMAVLNFLGEPLVAALSDRFGRKPFLMWGRLGMCAWFLTYTRVDLYGKLWMRLAGEAVCFGVVGVGHWTVFAAAHSDRFGSRPSLSAQIQSADRLWSLLGKVTGNVAGVLLTDQIGSLQVGHISHGLGLVTFWLLSQLPETLTKEKQKPFRFTHSNPLSNLVLLFCNGPGLRKLSLSALLYLGCNNVNMAHSGVQLGTLGWAVNAKSLFDSGTQIVQAGSEAFVAPQILAWGGRPSFQSVSLVAALA